MFLTKEIKLILCSIASMLFNLCKCAGYIAIKDDNE